MTSANQEITSGPWLSQRGRTDSEPRIRLFCLPHAGAGTAAYNIWKRSLPASIEVCPIQIPGRESRLSEPSCTDCVTLIESLTLALAGHLDKPYAIFGHSMGALLALDLAQNIRAHSLRQPSHLFVSGRNATHVPMKHGSIHQMHDDDFLAALATRYGGLPQEILDSPELLELYLPILRADLTLLETHQYQQLGPLDCPISAFSGKEDANVSHEGLEAWGEHTSAAFEAHWFDGGHFYLSGASRAPLLELIRHRLTDAVAGSPAAAASNG